MATRMKSSITKSKSGHYTVTARDAHGRMKTATGFQHIYDARIALRDLKLQLADQAKDEERAIRGTRINDMFIKPE